MRPRGATAVGTHAAGVRDGVRPIAIGDRRTRRRWRPGVSWRRIATRDSAVDASSISWQVRRISRNASTIAGSVRGSADRSSDMLAKRLGLAAVSAARAPRAPRAAAAGAIKRSRQRAAAPAIARLGVGSRMLHRAAASASTSLPPSVSASGARRSAIAGDPPHPPAGRSHAPASTPATSRGRHSSPVTPRTIRCGRASLVASLKSASVGIGRQPRVGGEDHDRAVLQPRRPSPARLRQHRAERVGRHRHEAGEPCLARQHALRAAPTLAGDGSIESIARGRPSRASASAARNACSDVAVSSSPTPPDVAFPHLDARRAAQIEVDQPASGRAR